MNQKQPKAPPHSVEAEQSVLAGLLLRNENLDEVASIVRAEDFYRADHQVIFLGCAEMIAARKPCDFVTLTEHLRNQGRVEDAGGAVYLASLTVDTYSIANVIAYAKIVRERSLLRKLIAEGSEIADLGYRPEGRSVDELVEVAERKVFALRASRAGSSGPRPLSEFIAQAEAEIDRVQKSGSGLSGLSTGFRWLDRMTKGLHPGDLVIVAARPGMGKTTVAFNVAQHVGFVQGRRALAFSMEMQGSQIAMRVLSSQARVGLSKLRGGEMEQGEWDRVVEAGGMARIDNIEVDETGALSPFEIRARARRVAAKGDLALIVVDYIQLMKIPGYRENRTNEVAEISRNLKALAKELGVPIMLLSQLTRDNERGEREPRLTDLRESGGMEQDADLVLFLHRPGGATEEATDESSASSVGVTKFIIGKQRQGPQGSTHMNFYGAVNRFEEMTRQEYDDYIAHLRAKVVAPQRGFGHDRKRAAAGDSA